MTNIEYWRRQCPTTFEEDGETSAYHCAFQEFERVMCEEMPNGECGSCDDFEKCFEEWQNQERRVDFDPNAYIE